MAALFEGRWRLRSLPLPMSLSFPAERSAGSEHDHGGRCPPSDRAGLTREVRTADPLLALSLVSAEVDRRLDRSGPYGAIAELIADETVTEISINGPGPVWVERAGTLGRSGVSVGPYELDLLIERILTPLGLRADRSSPIADARIEDGSRVNVVVPPLAIDGPALSIRRFTNSPLPLSDFGPAAMVEILSELVAARASVLIVGPTSSGKTTLLNSLSQLVAPTDRIVSIEDTAELRLAAANLVRLEARPANSEGAGEVGLRDLVRAALRMRPDRLVVGEVRGPEAFELLVALSSGHRGCLTTCHGAGPHAALRRLETLAAMAGGSLGTEQIRSLVHDGLDAVITVERTADGQRRVASVVELRDGHVVPRWSVDGAGVPMAAVIERLRAS